MTSSMSRMSSFTMRNVSIALSFMSPVRCNKPPNDADPNVARGMESLNEKFQEEGNRRKRVNPRHRISFIELVLVVPLELVIEALVNSE